ncbi:MAG: SH3 domain-containing protein [Spirochaetes bacterium]|nr:SH3 domain-containing protein [Spirochaetota bacterium]
MIKKCIFTIIIFLIILLCCKKTLNNNDVPLIKETDLEAKEIKKTKGIGVVNVDRLRFRSDNDLHSKTLRYLDKGIVVTILNKDYKRVRIGEMEDYWYQIEYDGITGWVFGYFLDIYSSYENAKIGAKKYIQLKTIDKKDNIIYYEDAINKNLFFLSNGKILQVIDGRKGIAKILKTQPGLIVVNYFFTKISSSIYYIAKSSSNLNGNGNLYFYDLNKKKNELILKDVYAADINEKNDIALVLSIQKSLKDNYWVIKSFDIKSKSNIKKITKIKQNRDSENLEDDIFSTTLQRELGSFVDLKMDKKANFIYFKPPEENQTYLISISNGDFIQVDIEQSPVYNIDSSQFITINSEQDIDGTGKYSIILKDKFSGMEKEIIRSQLYPISFSISPKKNFLAISMIDVNVQKDKYYPSSVYVLSLSTYSLIAISTEGESYQPKWSSTLLK